MGGQSVAQVVQVHWPVLSRVEYIVECIPHLILSGAGATLKDNKLGGVHLPGAHPRHEVPGPLDFMGNMRDLLIEELPLGFPSDTTKDVPLGWVVA